MEEIVSSAVLLLTNYALYMGSAFILCWIVLKKPLARRRVQQNQRSGPKNWIHDIKWSVASQGVFIAVGLVSSPLYPYSLARLPNTVTGTAVGLALVLLLDDAWFYWTHRALHTPKLYKRFHRTHHRSADPSPLTAFAFHPVEAITISGGGTVIGLLIGVPPATYVLFGWVSLFNNINGHLGYEWAPRFWHKIPVLGWKTPPTHHNLHHEKVRGNYGLYFTFWDKWMGTEFADYRQRFDAISQRPRHGSVAVAAGQVISERNVSTADMSEQVSYTNR
jgi:sterol desaturase/sphingolipid hydroxylase (fatty acid hydroxylase superfamily)